MINLILASKSKVRKEILNKNNISCEVEPSNVDEDLVKNSLLNEGASPEIISKNLAELKANKISQKKNEKMVLGADSVIDLDGELISKPENRDEAMNILKKLNGKKHHLISSVCISKNGITAFLNGTVTLMPLIFPSLTSDTIFFNSLSSSLIFSYIASILFSFIQ